MKPGNAEERSAKPGLEARARTAQGLGWLGLALAGACVISCVVSTHAGPGTEPVIPQKPLVSRAGAEPSADLSGPSEIGARHILVSYRGASHAAPYVTRTKEEARYLAVSLRERALSGEDFEQLARDSSDDRGSAAAGGELGMFRRDQMVPQFSKAAFALDVGAVSDVVESEFGFHVIQRTQ